MRIFQKNSIPVFLMAASLLLLAAFQAFWLRKEYHEQKSLLQKEADLIFRNTIQAMEDSMLQQKVSASFREQELEEGIASSAKRLLDLEQRIGQGLQEERASSLKKRSSTPRKADTLLLFGRTAEPTVRPERLPELLAREMKTFKSTVGSGDSLADALPPRRIFMRDSAGYSNIEIQIMTSSDKPDSIKQMVGRVLRPVQKMIFSKSKDSHPSGASPPPGKRFVIRLGQDSLKLRDLANAYAQRLQKANLSLPFTMQRNSAPSADSRASTLPTMTVMSSTPMGTKYAASFSDYRPYLFRKITPQILFSLFLAAITALAFAAIYRNMQRQQRLIALKNDFISNITHELKTPIATVSVALEALQNFGAARDPERIREYLAVSKNELDRLAMLVDKVLKTAQFEQHSLMLSPELLDADQLVQQVLHTMKPQFEKFGAQVSYELKGDAFGLMADRVHLTNVLFNLLDNAVKYSQELPQISIKIREEPDFLRLEVSDKGIGIPAAYRSKIFEKFFRVPSGNIHNVKGYGLGLSYVCSVVKSHGGRIEVASEPGQGSCFTVLLPVDRRPGELNTNTPVSHDTHQATVR